MTASTPITRTRILATLGPASWDPACVRAMLEAGASGFRLNFSHGRHDVLHEVVRTVHHQAAELGRPVCLVADLCGPKLRTGRIAGTREVLLRSGEEVLLSPGFEFTEPGRIAVDPEVFSGRIDPGTRILLSDGKLELEVLEVQPDVVRARVLHGGRLGSHKGVNLPTVKLEIPSLSEKDSADLDFALAHDFEFIALSFVREARDIVDVKQRIAEAGRTAGVIAKIESPLAVRNLDALLQVSDGIMVARGDLGVELGTEVLPVVQKQIIRTARQQGKLVATATQMLGSMTHAPRPTRAEASDVANAVFDGSDVVMLSEETAIGKFPVRAVQTMSRIVANAERSDLYKEMAALHRPAGEGVAHAAIRAACVAAEQLGARAIVPFTESGWTAYTLASYRPSVSILACTPDPRSYNRLALAWGVMPFLVPVGGNINDLYVEGMRSLIKGGAIGAGDMVVLISGSVVGGTGANTIKIYRVGTADLAEDAETRRRLLDLI